MKTKAGGAALAVLILALAGCSGMSEREQRTLSGGAIGAAGGVAIGALTGGSALLGGVVGGAGGAAIGALTTPSRPARPRAAAPARTPAPAPAAEGVDL